jgi:DNA repair exonuclease SbcCD ATPase subunit
MQTQVEGALVNARSQITSQQEALNDHDAKLEQFNVLLMNANDAVYYNANLLDETNKEKEKLKEENEKLNEEKERLATDLKQRSEENQRLRDSLMQCQLEKEDCEKAKKACRARVKELEKTVEDVTKDSKEKAAQIESLRKVVKCGPCEILDSGENSLTEEQFKATKKGGRETLVKFIKNHKELVAEYKRVKEALKTAQETASKDPQQAPDCEKKCEALQEEIDTLKAALGKASKDPQRAPECEKKCEALQQEVDSLNDTLKHKRADDRVRQVHHLNAELKAMKAQLQGVPPKPSTGEIDAAAQEKIRSLTTELDAAKKNVESARISADAAADATQEEIRSLTAELNAAKKGAKAVRGASDDEINAAAQEQIRTLTAELDAAKKDAEAATGTSNNEIDTAAQEKNPTLTVELDAARHEIASIRTQAEAEIARVAKDLKARILKHTSEVETFNRHIGQQPNDLSGASQACSVLVGWASLRTAPRR